MAIAVIGIVFSAFQAATYWAIVFSIALVIVFSWWQSQRLVDAQKRRKLQTQDISASLTRPNLEWLTGDGGFAYKIADTKFYEESLLSLRAELGAPFFEAIPADVLLVYRPLDRLRRNAVQVFINNRPIGWLEVDKQNLLVERLDSVDGIALVKGRVTFGLKAESHSVLIDLPALI